jgi:hypothetical protein
MLTEVVDEKELTVFLNFSGWWFYTAGMPLAGVAAPAWMMWMFCAMGLSMLVSVAVFYVESLSSAQRAHRPLQPQRAKPPRRFRVIATVPGHP